MAYYYGYECGVVGFNRVGTLGRDGGGVIKAGGAFAWTERGGGGGRYVFAAMER